jgi:hypothetical protein
VNSKDMFVNVSGEYRTFSAQIEIVLKWNSFY